MSSPCQASHARQDRSTELSGVQRCSGGLLCHIAGINVHRRGGRGRSFRHSCWGGAGGKEPLLLSHSPLRGCADRISTAFAGWQQLQSALQILEAERQLRKWAGVSQQTVATVPVTGVPHKRQTVLTGFNRLPSSPLSFPFTSLSTSQRFLSFFTFFPLCCLKTCQPANIIFCLLNYQIILNFWRKIKNYDYNPLFHIYINYTKFSLM